MMVTLVITFVYETSYGLAAGIGGSAIFYVANVAFDRHVRAARTALTAHCCDVLHTLPLTVSIFHSTSQPCTPRNQPHPVLHPPLPPPPQTQPSIPVPVKQHPNGFQVVKLESHLTFIQSERMKDYVTNLVLEEPPNASNANGRSEYVRLTIANFLDKNLSPTRDAPTTLPKAIVIDMESVRITDVTGLAAMSEVMGDVRKKGVLIALINMTGDVQAEVEKFGIKNDTSTETVDLDGFLAKVSASITPPHPRHPFSIRHPHFRLHHHST